MPRIIEISGKIEDGMWDYNGLELGGAVLPMVRVHPIATIAQNGFDAHALTLTTLTGTYLETAAHLISGSPTLDQVPVERLIQPARLMRLPYVQPSAVIELPELVQNDPQIQPGEALIIDTGWWRYWNQPGYVEKSPHFSVTTLEWLLYQPFSILGLDTPVADRAGEILLPLFEKGMLMAAPLVNLGSIWVNTGRLIVLPIHVVGVCSAPCRAVFMEGTL
jgi:kynurenine formamidase